jgi:hypothetical protein
VWNYRYANERCHFSISGVENFLEGVMRTDMQDILGRMEGFAVQGIQGIIQIPTLPDVL